MLLRQISSISGARDDGISILDQSLDIDWRIPVDRAILSEKDTKHQLLKDFISPFKYNVESTNKL